MTIVRLICGGLVSMFAALLLSAGTVSAQSTAFTFQGRLNTTNGPANGNFEFQFLLFDAAVNGNQIGNTLTVLPVAVSNGLFTVSLDFGAAAFNGASRWIEVCVGPFPLVNQSDHIYLNPRLAVNSAPYSIQALTAATVTGSVVASAITSGTLPDARLSTNVAVLDANGTLTLTAPGGINFFSAAGGTLGSGPGVRLVSGGSAWGIFSDRNVKKNLTPLDGREVLEKLDKVPVTSWNYKWEKDGETRNIGPMAQDFKGAFYPGRDDKIISTLEFDGVELAAIKGLHQLVKEKDAQITDLEKRVADLEQLVKALAEKK